MIDARFLGGVQYSFLMMLLEMLVFLFLVHPLPDRMRAWWKKAGVCAGLLASLLLTQMLGFEFVFDIAAKTVAATCWLLVLKKTKLKNCLYISAVFFLIHDIARLLALEIVMQRAFPAFFLSQTDVAITVWHVLVVSGILFVLVAALRPFILSNRIDTYSLGQILCIAFPILAYVCIRYCQFAFKYLDPLLADGMTLAAILLSAACIASVIGIERVISVQIEKIEKLSGDLLQRQQEHYLKRQEGIESFNERCHEIRHQLLRLEAACDIDEMKGEIAAIRGGCDFGQLIDGTGNETLDIVLSEKLAECERRGILFIPVVDGRVLSFMSPSDLCIVFGNALDNAFEAVMAQTQGAREIDVKVAATEYFVVCRFANTVEKPPAIRNGMIVGSGKEGRTATA